MNRTRIMLSLMCVLVPLGMLHAQWYDSYERGRRAVRSQQWQQAVNLLTEAIGEESSSKANKKTYGLQFIDYFPYLYRGIAYYRLGDIANARADLEKAKGEGAVDDAQRDEEAPRLLTEYLALAGKPAPQAAEQKTPEKPPPAQPEPDPKYTEGVRLFNQKDYKGALDQFNAVPESSPQHAQALRYIDRAQTELRRADAAEAQKQKGEQVEREFTAGVRLFNDGDLDRAEERLNGVIALDRSHAGAKDFLNRIRARRKQQALAAARGGTKGEKSAEPPAAGGGAPAPDTAGSALFRDAVALFQAGKSGRAKAEFQTLRSRSPGYPELAGYIQRIEEAEQKARSGIAAFFEGEYREAIKQLSASSKDGSDNPHLYAFLACAYAAEYLLDGGVDGNLRKEAVEAFGRTRGLDPRYELDSKYVSPRIIALLTGN